MAPRRAARRATPVRRETPRRVAWGRWAMLAALAIGLGGAATWVSAGLGDPATWPVRTLRIEGELRRVSADTLRRTVQPHVANGFWAVSLHEVRDAVQALPWVAEASVRRVWPDALAVSLREWVPVARWGETGLVTAEGRVYEPQDGLPPELPRLAGPEDRVGDVLAAHRQLTQALQPADLTVAALTLAPEGTWQARLNNGVELVLGKTDLEERVRRFLAAAPVLTGGDRAVARVDLRYTNGLAVRWMEAGASAASVGES